MNLGPPPFKCSLTIGLPENFHILLEIVASEIKQEGERHIDWKGKIGKLHELHDYLHRNAKESSEKVVEYKQYGTIKIFSKASVLFLYMSNEQLAIEAIKCTTYIYTENTKSLDIQLKTKQNMCNIYRRLSSVTQSCLTLCEDRKSTRLNSSHSGQSRMPSSA